MLDMHERLCRRADLGVAIDWLEGALQEAQEAEQDAQESRLSWRYGDEAAESHQRARSAEEWRERLQDAIETLEELKDRED